MAPPVSVPALPVPGTQRAKDWPQKIIWPWPLWFVFIWAITWTWSMWPLGLRTKKYLIIALLLLFHVPASLGLYALLPMDCSCNIHVWSLVCRHPPTVMPFIHWLCSAWSNLPCVCWLLMHHFYGGNSPLHSLQVPVKRQIREIKSYVYFQKNNRCCHASHSPHSMSFSSLHEG